MANCTVVSSTCFSDLPTNSTATVDPFFALGPPPIVDEPARVWIAAGGAASKSTTTAGLVRIRLTVFRSGGPEVWRSEVSIAVGGAVDHLRFDWPSGELAGVDWNNSYGLKIETLDAGLLLPDDVFWVVAIDMDDGPDPLGKTAAGNPVQRSADIRQA